MDSRRMAVAGAHFRAALPGLLKFVFLVILFGLFLLLATEMLRYHFFSGGPAHSGLLTGLTGNLMV
jgi:hypothetical protein